MSLILLRPTVPSDRLGCKGGDGSDSFPPRGDRSVAAARSGEELAKGNDSRLSGGLTLKVGLLGKLSGCDIDELVYP